MDRNDPVMKGLRFSPGKASTLATILLFPFLISLGFWQLDRAQLKLSLYAQVAANRNAPLLQLSTASEVAEPLVGRTVRASGKYQAPSLLLDNRLRDGRSGYEVITPFELDDGTHLLIARGWMAADLDRTRFPDIGLPTHAVSLTGRIGRVPVAGIRLGKSSEIEKLDPGLFRVQRVETELIAQQLGYPLPPSLLYLDPTAPNGFDRNWPIPTGDVSKHHGYAVQWFAMAVVLVLLYLRINLQYGTSREGR